MVTCQTPERWLFALFFFCSKLQTTQGTEKWFNTIADVKILSVRRPSFILCFSTDLKHDAEKIIADPTPELLQMLVVHNNSHLLL